MMPICFCPTGREKKKIKGLGRGGKDPCHHFTSEAADTGQGQSLSGRLGILTRLKKDEEGILSCQSGAVETAEPRGGDSKEKHSLFEGEKLL